MTAYLLQVAAGILVAWVIYRLALRGKAAARTNRFFLLGGLILPFALPLISLPAGVVAAANPILLPAVDVSRPFMAETSSQLPVDWLWFVYVGGVLSMLFYQAGGLFTVYRLRRRAIRTSINKKVFEVSEATMPFSFFGQIYLPNNLDSEQKALIIAHEEKHVNRAHSYDMLLGSLVHSFLWFLPVLPFYLRDLRLEHEFEVDQLMLNETSFSHYAENLLKVSLMPIHHVNFHSFSSPKLKNRIIMMTKKQKLQTWKLLFLVPVACSLIYLNACNKQQDDAVIEGKPASDMQFETTPNGTEVLGIDQVSVLPQFPDCATDESFEAQQNCFFSGTMKHISENLVYPESARKAGVEGRVFVEFVVSETGQVIEAYIKRGIENPNNDEAVEAANKAALEVFGTFPELIAAEKDGQPVAIKFVVPINFKLN